MFVTVGDGNLKLVEIASVLGAQADSAFMYAEGESDATVWPG